MLTLIHSDFRKRRILKIVRLTVVQSRLRSFGSCPRAKATRSSGSWCSCTDFRSPWWILRDAGPTLAPNQGALGKKSRAERAKRKDKRAGSLASLLYIGHSMIPAEEQGGWSRIFYLHTTNCSSFSQLGIKDCLSCYTFLYILLCNLFSPPFFSHTCLFSAIRERSIAFISAPPQFLSRNQFFFLLFLSSSRSKDSLLLPSLIIVDPFLLCGEESREE